MRNDILANAARLAEAMGDWMPACTPALRDAAEHLTRDEVALSADGRTWTPVDLATVDWTGQTAPHPPCAHGQLMRFRLLVPLASAYRATGDERFAQAARRYLEAFLRCYPVTAAWTPPLHDGATSFPGRIGCSRSAGWLGTLPALLPSPAFDDAFLATLIEAVRHVLNYLHAHLYPGRNIRILHGDTLLLNSLRLSFLPEAAAWRTTGVRILNDAIARQVLPDGADMEGSTEYHADVLHLFEATFRLAHGFPELGLRLPAETLAAMYDYLLASVRPDGAFTALNDASYYPPRGEFGDRWARTRRAFRQTAGLTDQPPPLARHFADVNQIFVRDTWGPDATYLVFDATTRRGWHWHPSRNALALFAHRRALLVDPGYPLMFGNAPRYGHATAHHSTLNVNGWDQSHARAWARLRQAPGYDLIEGLYGGGYWPTDDDRRGPGVFGEHHRAVLWVRGRCVVVLDLLALASRVDDEVTVESVWPLSEGGAQLGDDGASAWTTHADGNLLLLFPLRQDAMQLALHCGDEAPMRGWVPDGRLGRNVPAPLVRLHGRERDLHKVHLATVLVPFAGAARPVVRATAARPGIRFGDRTAGRLDLAWPDGTSDLVVWSARLEEAIDQQHGLDTDASLVHLAFTAGGRLLHGAAADAHFLLCPAAGPGDLLAQVQRL